MHSFKDAKGDEWSIEITFGTLKALRCDLYADFLKVFDRKTDDDHPLLRVCQDIVFAVDVLWVVCSKQAADRSIDEESFAFRLGAEAGYDAHQALLAEFEDFFRRLKRPELEKLVRTQAEMIAAGLEKMQEAVTVAAEMSRRELADLDVEAIMTRERTGRTSGNSRGSSELISGI